MYSKVLGNTQNVLHFSSFLTSYFIFKQVLTFIQIHKWSLDRKMSIWHFYFTLCRQYATRMAALKFWKRDWMYSLCHMYFGNSAFYLIYHWYIDFDELIFYEDNCSSNIKLQFIMLWSNDIRSFRISLIWKLCNDSCIAIDLLKMKILTMNYQRFLSGHYCVFPLHTLHYYLYWV